MAKTRKCSICHKPGCRADRHKADLEPDPGPLERAREIVRSSARVLGAVKPRVLELVASDDVPAVKVALSGVLEALEPVDPKHRRRILRSAALVLAEEL
jgi:hypothetical protein